MAITPGADFGVHRAHQHVRFAYTTSMDSLREGVERIAAHLRKRAAAVTGASKAPAPAAG